MVWGCMSAAGTGELLFIEGTMNAIMYCDILKQSMIPSLRRLGRRAVFQQDNDPKHTSKTTTALLKKLRVKVMDWLSMFSDLNPIDPFHKTLMTRLTVISIFFLCILNFHLNHHSLYYITFASNYKIKYLY